MSTTAATAMSSTTVRPTISSVAWPSSVRSRRGIGGLLELTDGHGVGGVEREARGVAAEDLRHQREVDARRDGHGDDRGAGVAVVGVRRASDADVDGLIDPLVVERLAGGRLRAG